ncbi:hypothetical protein TWF694_000617 [Orbilia ellipsospora]|uniref:DUF6923 domain-containing protein n=1 Tax=Orbilia ellipsospora TaxID=2528407 RepID=A0AAV9XQM9_9PEZI
MCDLVYILRAGKYLWSGLVITADNRLNLVRVDIETHTFTLIYNFPVRSPVPTSGCGSQWGSSSGDLWMVCDGGSSGTQLLKTNVFTMITPIVLSQDPGPVGRNDGTRCRYPGLTG